MDTSRILYIFIFSFFLNGGLMLAFVLLNKSKAKADNTMTDQEFVLRHPWIVAALMASLSVCLSVLMVVSALESDKTAEYIGVFVGYGLPIVLFLILMLKALLFKVVVSGERLTLYNAFRKPYEFTFADIASVVHKTKNNPLADKIIIRTNTGKKLVAEGTDTSYERLLKRIESEVSIDRLQGFDLPAADALRAVPELEEYGAPVPPPFDNGGVAGYCDPMAAYRLRNLTIKRGRSFVGGLSRLKVYVEDHRSCDLIINDIPCRKLGELKNGEEKTFQVPTRSAKVYVIAKNWSRNFCNDFYRLPEGQEDVVLSGECKFNLLCENAFRFDNNETAEVAENRKRGAKKGAGVLAAALIVGFVVGYAIGYYFTSGRAPSERVFTCENMSIRLTEGFREADYADEFGGEAVYESNNVVLLVIKEPFTMADGLGDLTIDQYIDLAIQNIYLDNGEKLNATGLNGFQYKYVEAKTNETIYYTCFAYKSADAFWLLQFATYEEDTERYAASIEDWARSVRFTVETFGA